MGAFDEARTQDWQKSTDYESDAMMMVVLMLMMVVLMMMMVVLMLMMVVLMLYVGVDVVCWC